MKHVASYMYVYVATSSSYQLVDQAMSKSLDVDLSAFTTSSCVEASHNKLAHTQGYLTLVPSLIQMQGMLELLKVAHD